MEAALPRRIGDIARAAGVGVETVRFYEREGLIDQPEKPLRGWRDYGEDALLQLGYVRLAREMGLTLADVKRLKPLASGARAPFCVNVRETVSQRLAATEAKIAELERTRATLARWLDLCARREAAAECPLHVQLQRVVKPPPSKPRR